MLSKILAQHSRTLFFIFSTSISCGIVFFSVLVGFGYMLAEEGVSASVIASLFLGTLPYSFKFAISPFVKNLITRFQKHGIKTIKVQAYVTEFITIIGISLLGLHTKNSPFILMFVHILIIVLAGAIHDLLGDYLRLSHFKDKLLGTATSLGTIGFRLGMLFSSAGILYIASYLGWKYAFPIIASIIFISVLATFTLSNEKLVIAQQKEKMNSLKNYINFCSKLFKKHGILIILSLTFSFKFSDSCINGLKAVFLQTRGFSKVDFANISQIIGIFVIMLAGTIAASLTYTYNLKKCMKYAFIFQAIPSICFIYLTTTNNCSFVMTAILINIVTFFLGFSSVIYRVYVSKLSNSDINIYTVLLSIGSIFRSISLYLGGYIVDIFSWKMLYIICFLSNIPGMFVCFFKTNSKKYNVIDPHK